MGSINSLLQHARPDDLGDPMGSTTWGKTLFAAEKTWPREVLAELGQQLPISCFFLQLRSSPDFLSPRYLGGMPAHHQL